MTYVGLDALIRNKKAAARPKDMDDLPYLTEALRGGVAASERRSDLGSPDLSLVAIEPRRGEFGVPTEEVLHFA